MARAAGNTVPTPRGVPKTVPLVLVAVVGALSTVVFHPMVGLPIAGVALAALAYGGRTQVSVTTSIVAGLLTGALASETLYVVVFPLTGVPVTARAPYVFTALAIASLLLVGPITAGMMRRWSALKSLAALTVALTTVQVGALVLFAAGAGQSLGSYVSSAVTSLASQVGMVEEMSASIVSMWPGALASMNGFTAMFVIVGVGVAGARFGVKLRPVPALAVLDLDPRAVVLPILAIALLAAGRLPVAVAPALDIMGMNLLVIVRWIFFLQGIAAFAGLYERAKFARPVRVFGFILLGVTEAFVPAVSLTGLADIWLNLRRLPRDASAPGLPGATPEAD